MKIKTTAENKFKAAVENTKDIKDAYQGGLKALGASSLKIELKKACEGSVNIDSAVEKLYPQAPRWDYCFSYENEVFFVEVHPADTSQVSRVIEKLAWLKAWLKSYAPELNALKAQSRPPFYWIQTKGYHILKTSQQYKKLVQYGINPVSKLSL